MTTNERRQIKPEEWAAIGELAAAAPDLSQVKDRLLAALVAHSPRTAPGATHHLAWQQAQGGLRPSTWKELTEAVRMGILPALVARRYVDIPPGKGSLWRTAWRAFWLRAQRGGAVELEEYQ
ncbi:MAG: hypothetical protein ACREOA_00590 [Candidatus Dormibacteria bacterium]